MCVSESTTEKVRERYRNKKEVIDIEFEYTGEHTHKHLARSVVMAQLSQDHVEPLNLSWLGVLASPEREKESEREREEERERNRGKEGEREREKE